MRSREALRRLIRETEISLSSLVMPYFVSENLRAPEPIGSMPGHFRWNLSALLKELQTIQELGLSSILLFGIPREKNDSCTPAFDSRGVLQEAVRSIKEHFSDLTVITDVCLCAYTKHGHCGVLNRRGEIDNDASLSILNRTAISHAEAGADMVAPSDMMDGRVRAIREGLESGGFPNVPIMSYAAKYASAFYGPFREVAHSAPAAGDRKSYQMDPANREEALREIALDIEEGADLVMVKPALAYLDVIREASEKFRFPLAAYNVSGEFVMVKAAAQAGWLDEQQTVLEVLTGIRRAGARVILTYHAREVAEWASRGEISQKIPLKS